MSCSLERVMHALSTLTICIPKLVFGTFTHSHTEMKNEALYPVSRQGGTQNVGVPSPYLGKVSTLNVHACLHAGVTSILDGRLSHAQRKRRTFDYLTRQLQRPGEAGAWGLWQSGSWMLGCSDAL